MFNSYNAVLRERKREREGRAKLRFYRQNEGVLFRCAAAAVWLIECDLRSRYNNKRIWPRSKRIYRRTPVLRFLRVAETLTFELRGYLLASRETNRCDIASFLF